MGTRKIRDLARHETCRDPDHDPAKNRLFADGVYEHECPACGWKQQFTVRHPVYRGAWFSTGNPQLETIKRDE